MFMYAKFHIRPRPHPVTRWLEGIRDLGNQGMRLLNPIACSALSCFGVSAICVSPKFHILELRMQVFLLFGVTLYVAMTGVVTFGSWSTLCILNTTTRPNAVLRALQRFISRCFIIWVWSEVVFTNEYALSLGVGILAVQSQYLLRLQGYHIRGNTISCGMVALFGMVMINEFNTRVSTILAILAFIAAIVFDVL